MEEEKRYDLVLQVAQELKSSGMEFHWYLVGDGPMLDKMQAVSRRLGLEHEVTFTGRLENPCPLMKQCDALIVLSDYEGTPVTIDEAKVLGLPVLARDVGGVREQLDGKYGQIIQKNVTSVDIPPAVRFTRGRADAYQNVIERQVKLVFEIPRKTA